MKVGLDYGTSTTLVSVCEENNDRSEPKLLNIGGNRPGYMRSSVPSVIAVNRNGKFFFGYDAEKIASEDESAIILRSLKRCLACERKVGEGIEKCINHGNFPFCVDPQKMNLFDKEYSIDDLVTRFLNEVFNLIGRPANTLAVTVPAIFGSAPRQKLFNIILGKYEKAKKASTNTVAEIVNEPTAVVRAISGVRSSRETTLSESDGIYAICDVGGGTTDIVVFEKRDRSLFLFRPSGVQVAGDDVDNRLLDNLRANDHGNVNKIDNGVALTEVRRAKELLTVSKEVSAFGRKLTREQFHKFVDPVLIEIGKALEKEIKKVFDAYKPYSMTGQRFRLETIYLSGGGAKIPRLKELIEKGLAQYDAQVKLINDRIYGEDFPIFAVALGAATPKDEISDSIQQMLPYSIEVEIGGVREVKAPIYQELPHTFQFQGRIGDNMRILACDPNNNSEPIHDLTAELESTEETKKMPLWQLMKQSILFTVKISEFNIMWVTAGVPEELKSPKRPFPLPWQGGIEMPLFDKYKREWRRQHGYS